jgi:putative membrane protein
MPHTHHAAVESVCISTGLIFAALMYLLGWLRNRSSNRESVARWRPWVFLIGLLCIWIATVSPLGELDHALLTAHMVQHLLLMTIAPPLILLGAPVKPLAHLRSRSMQTIGRALTQPAFCWLAAAGTLVAWHIPSMFMLGMRSEAWHAIEQVSFLASGLLFWWPVVQPWQRASHRSEWSTLLYLFLATLPCDILSGFLVFCDRVVYPVYFSTPQPLGFSALQDQQCAGALMWTCVTVVYFIAGTTLTARLLSPGASGHNWVARSDSPLSASTQTTRSSLEVI